MAEALLLLQVALCDWACFLQQLLSFNRTRARAILKTRLLTKIVSDKRLECYVQMYCVHPRSIGEKGSASDSVERSELGRPSYFPPQG